MILHKYFEKLWKDYKEERKLGILRMLGKSNLEPILLDCGCDDGKFTLSVSKKINTKNIYGIEINKKASVLARRLGVKVKNSDLNSKFPFANNLFDLVTADQVIEHLYDLDNFLSEISRVLKTGGEVIISTENLASWHNIFALLLGFQPFSGPSPSEKKVVGYHPLTPSRDIMKTKHDTTIDMPGHIKVLTCKALENLVSNHGFRIEKAEGYGYIPLPNPLARCFAKFDRWHAFFITIRARKVI
jgi:SAM-dependent methyltransferase